VEAVPEVVEVVAVVAAPPVPDPEEVVDDVLEHAERVPTKPKSIIEAFMRGRLVRGAAPGKLESISGEMPQF